MQRQALDEAVLRAALGERWPQITVVEQTESTNADLLRDSAVPDRAALFAEYQSAGRGRLDRSWVSPPSAGLIVSVALRPSTPANTWGWLPLLAGVALREAVAEVAGVATAVKWPNDLLHEQGKLAGILAQSNDSLVVLGIGLNVSTTRAELPVDTATSLALCGADDVDRTRLAVAVLRQLDTRVRQWSDAGGDAAAAGLLDDYRAACATLGCEVSVSATDGGQVVGRAVDIDASGHLLVESNGTVRTIGVGDVHHVRAIP